MQSVLARLAQASDAGLPTFETRKALIIINLQNDSLYVKDDLYVTKNQDFVSRLKDMIPYFRKHGDIIWVLTHMGVAPSAVGSQSTSTSQKTASASDQEKPKDDKSEQARLRNERLVEIAREEAAQGELDVIDPDAGSDYPVYPTSKSRQMMARAPPEAKAEKRSADLQVFDDKDNIAEKYFSEPKKGHRSRFFIAGTKGAQIADELLDEVDDSRDMIMTKRHYSAFDSTSLLTQLRANLITEVYLCGCMTNVGVYSTAADAVQHGLAVTVVEDCLGYRSEEKHEEAIRQMADIMGVSGIDSEEIIEESGGRPVPDAQTPGITLEELTLNSPRLATQASLPPTDTKSVSQPDISRGTTKTKASEPKQQKSPSKSRTTPTPQGVEPTSKDPSAGSSGKRKQGGDHPRNPSPGPSGTKSRRSWNLSRSQILGPKDSIGSGDSKIIYKALSPSLVNDVFSQLKDEVDWQTMLHRSGQVPRLVAVQGEIGKSGEIPIYRHPADESPPLLDFSSTVQKIRQDIEALLGQSFNHALIQLYRNGIDNISEHADKTLDIVRNSMIVNVSLGAQRSMTLRVKKSKHAHGTDSPSMRQSQRIKMPHNSVFVLGPQTNREWLHGVRADKRPTQEKSEDEKAFGGERISITFRQIGTFMNKKDKTIWGAGAKAKRKSQAGRISTKDSAQMDAMIQAFGKENHNADFNWDKYYGKGFDVVNLINEQAKLFLCGDPVANLRVQLALCEKQISFTSTEREKPTQPEYGMIESRFQPWVHGLSNIENPVLHDVDDNATEVEGDVAILFYLEKTYPFQSGANKKEEELSSPSDPPPNIYSQISQSNDLLFLWRQLRASQSPNPPEDPASNTKQQTTTHRFNLEKVSNTSLHDELRSTLESWEERAKDHEYIISNDMTIVDCAFWPVLREIMEEGKGKKGEDTVVDWNEYPSLVEYYERVLSRDGVGVVVEGGGAK